MRERHLVPFVMYVGLINAYSVGQMIIAHLVKKEFPYRNVLLLPLLVGVVDGVCGSRAYLGLWGGGLLFGGGNGGEVYQVALVFCSLGLAVGVYGSFVVGVFILSPFLSFFVFLSCATGKLLTCSTHSSTSSPPSAITWTSGACPSNTLLSRARQLNQQKPSRRRSSILPVIIIAITLPRRRRVTKAVQV